MSITNPTIIKKLCGKWETLSEEEKSQTRSIRARQGIKCQECGKVGYFTPICPCQQSISKNIIITEEQHDIPNGVAKIAVAHEVISNKKELDVKEASILAQDERVRLHQEDSQHNVANYDYFATAAQSYTTSLASLTLFQVLRKLIRLIEQQLESNILKLESTHDPSILVPPDSQIKDDAIRQALLEFKEYRHYFFNKEQKGAVKSHNIKSIEDLNKLYGKKQNSHLYGKGSMVGSCSSLYSSIGWKSVLGSDDFDSLSLAEERPRRPPVHTSNWLQLQSDYMKSRNDNYEHLMSVISYELQMEHKREMQLLKCEVSEKRVAASKVWSERIDAADRIIQTLIIYQLSSGAEEADFYIYFLKKWKDANKKGKVSSSSIVSSSSVVSVGDVGDDQEAYDDALVGQELEDSMSSTQMRANNSTISATSSSYPTLNTNNKTKKHQRKKKGKSVKGGSRSHVSLASPSPLVSTTATTTFSATTSKGGTAQGSSSLSAPSIDSMYKTAKPKPDPLKKEEYFRNAGLAANIRNGKEDSPSFDLPALVDVSSTFRERSLDSDVSHLVTQISLRMKSTLNRERLSQKGKETMTPLYYRHTQLEDNGNTSYNIGATFDALGEDRRLSTNFSRPILNFAPKRAVHAPLIQPSTSLTLQRTTIGDGRRSREREHGERTKTLKFSKLSSFAAR